MQTFLKVFTEILVNEIGLLFLYQVCSLYFEMFMVLQEIAKVVQRGPVDSTPFLPVVIFYITVLWYQNQEVNIGTLSV